MKIIGVGLNKTGTKSLSDCFRIWGLTHRTWDIPALKLWHDGRVDEVLKLMADYESFEDCPWYLVYREVDEAFKDTKFILTRRRDPETWYKSYCRWARRIGPNSEFFQLREWVYGHAQPQAHKAEFISVYLRHNDAVRKYFKNQPEKFLEVCWEEGSGWKELSQFLGFRMPNMKFPHANKTTYYCMLKRLILQRIRRQFKQRN